jgi:hypothetical protein
MSAEDTLPGTLSYPQVATQYAAANAGALQLGDTQSLFNLNGPPVPAFNPSTDVAPGPPNAIIYTLPGQYLYNPVTTPNSRLLMANLAAGGVAVICPYDYLAQFPALANFRGIYLNSVGDFAYVRWTGVLWALGETGGPTVTIASLEQNEL